MRHGGKWKCYVVPVPGMNHDQESQDLWRSEGTQLPEHEARVFFPDLNPIPYAS